MIQEDARMIQWVPNGIGKWTLLRTVLTGFRRFRFVHGISVFMPYVSLNNICLCNDEEKGMSCVIQGRFFEADMRICL